jgi:hypothetical protein
VARAVNAKRGIALVISAAVLAAGCGGRSAKKEDAVPGVPEGTKFTARVDNEWFPLAPGTVLVYRGVKDGKPSRDVVEVTADTKKIDGVPVRIVSDRLYVEGRLAERTTDWYTQDERGNVWYFGEDTAELDKHGRVTSTEGTWQAGRDGAEPGIFMPAHPKVGDGGRQEYYKGHAEDRFEILSVNAAARVPAVASKRALLTKETTPLEPGVVDHKYYVRGVGTVLEQTVEGGNERNTLVTVRRAGA